ncbi:hypothetical protein MUK42_05319 [Musa troglodytarum]|uniref:PPPDE domain-containing protein n=1 Tax=Musa troglodytarum TaxID=320322 RepID=A0A9E7HHH3_9LILI|nr:hypothetical protein MUK42_05319 [Musa troglodytarum]
MEGFRLRMASLVRRLFKREKREREGDERLWPEKGEETRERMQEVVAHVYDVTNSPSEKTNNTVSRINCICKDCVGLGGIFHSAIQVYGTHEWSFGYRERGSGVFHCSQGQNQFYTYRQSIVLGETHCSQSEVNKILRELIRAWTGDSYDPLSKNCNHFCDAFCEKLGVRKLPGK